MELARVFREERYELKPVLKALFKSRHFYDHSNVASVIKSPVQLVVQAIRSFQTPGRNINYLLTALEMMGQNIFYPPSVKGWEGGRSWINTSTLFTRHNVLVYLLTGRQRNRHKGAKPDFDATHIFKSLHSNSTNDSSVRDRVSLLARFCLGAETHSERINTLVQYVNERGGRLDNPTLIGLLALITAMPEYQLC